MARFLYTSGYRWHGMDAHPHIVPSELLPPGNLAAQIHYDLIPA